MISRLRPSQPLHHSRILLKGYQHLWDRPRGFQDVAAKSPGNYVGSEIIQAENPSVSNDHTVLDVPTRATSLDMGDLTRLDSQCDPFGVKELVTVEDLFKARVHFGHKASMWDPRMKPYLYGIRNKIHIINLNTTLINLHRALNVMGHVAYRHGIILFVNERPQFEILTEQIARGCKEYFVTKWIPGTLSNSYQLLKTLVLPDLIVFTSMTCSIVAVREAVSFGTPSVGVVDSNCNPDSILYPIPGNDDSPQSVILYYDLFSEVIRRAKELRVKDDVEAEKRREMEVEMRREMQEKRTSALDNELNSLLTN